MKRNIFNLSIILLVFASPLQTSAQLNYKNQSVLSSGEWHKIAVDHAGIYKLDHQFITAQMGLNAGSLDARQISIFGNRGGALPQRVGESRIDDLEELSTLRVGLDDGSFDANDYIMFYAEGPDSWSVDDENQFYMVKNIYDVNNHYFIGIGVGQSTEVLNTPTLLSGDLQIETFDAYAHLEEDRVNLLGKFLPPGSGKRWFGDEFSAVRNKTYTLDFPNVIIGSNVQLTVLFAGRSGNASTVSVEAGGLQFSQFIGSVGLGSVQDDYARIGRVTGSYLAGEESQTLIISYPSVTGTLTTGWLDFIQLQTTCALQFDSEALTFRNIESQYYETVEYAITGGGSNVEIWDITDPLIPVSREYILDGSVMRFATETEATIREYITFDKNASFPRPEYSGPVGNQNLHSLTGADLLVIYHPDFTEAAMRLAEHRRDHDGYRVEMAPIQMVYNEFSGGSVDVTAIRDLASMLRVRDSDFRFLLLVGDGTYDMRHLNQDLEDDNFIPVYETDESLDPIRSFPSDDYFALLNETEGNTLRGAIDIAVGRLPVGSKAEADAVVNKIIDYDLNPASLSDWRMRLVYVADDEDSNLHLNQSEDISRRVEDNFELFNLNRIYLDAFQQMSTPGGARYPDVNVAINNSIFKGALTLNYLGHGGHLGWSQERILGLSDIQSWNNYDRLPVFVTATCSFTGYDEPSYQSAGEQVLLNPNGGAVALLTTVRAVYSSSNKRLTNEVFKNIFKKVDGSYLPLGDVMRIAKNSNMQDTIDINARKFAIIGDPSMYLALPHHTIAITEVNGNPVGNGPDTARALEHVTLKGEVREEGGATLEFFNGEALVTVYDKPVKIRTLANDPKSFERDFENLSRIIFKGSATVTNGEFQISFVIPEDIDFTYGNGKVSIYASDGISVDAGGHFKDLIIGGTAENVNVDNEGPDIRLFLDYESFISGGNTGPNPTLLLLLSDASGINVIGNSIGHDLVAVLDNDNRQSFILNDFYKARIDDFTSGEVRFPLSDLALGEHTITVTAWDVAGNFSEASITFVVTDNPGVVIRNVRNYPNPFAVTTQFEFEYNLPAAPVNAYIDIFDTWGRLITSIEHKNVLASNGVVTGMHWDGTGVETRQHAQGVYVYQVRLVANPGSSTQTEHKSAFKKLILIN